MAFPTDPHRHHRRRLQLETLTGFVGFFAALALVQAVINAFRPEPQVWPSLLALGLLALTWLSWRAWRRYRP